MVDTHPDHWWRQHANGVMSDVRRQTPHEDIFVYFAATDAEPIAAQRDFRGTLLEAQAAADAASGCRPQPCSCPPWSE